MSSRLVLSIVALAARRAASLLPVVATRVSVDVDPGGAIPGIGVGGSTVVSVYLRRHPALTAADLVTTDAETTLRGSGFHT